MLNREEFLRGLEMEALRHLPPLEALSMVAEARDHLEESIQARLELGETAEEAEASAIAAFGSARKVGNETGRRRGAIDRPFLYSCLALVAFWGMGALIRVILQPFTIPLIMLTAAVHVAFLVTSVYARRIQFVALAIVFLPLWLGWSMKQAHDHVYVTLPGAESVYRTHHEWLAGEIEGDRVSAARLRTTAKALTAAYREFQASDSTLSPSRSLTFIDEVGQLKLYQRATRAEAAAMWTTAMSYVDRNAERAALLNEAQAKALEVAADGPWLPHVPEEAAIALGEGVWAITAGYVGLHVTGWLAGQILWFRRRRKGRLA